MKSVSLSFNPYYNLILMATHSEVKQSCSHSPGITLFDTKQITPRCKVVAYEGARNDARQMLWTDAKQCRNELTDKKFTYRYHELPLVCEWQVPNTTQCLWWVTGGCPWILSNPLVCGKQVAFRYQAVLMGRCKVGYHAVFPIGDQEVLKYKVVLLIYCKQVALKLPSNPFGR